MGVEEGYPSEAVEERIDFQFLHSLPNYGIDYLSYYRSYHEHLIDFVQLAIDPILALIEILDVQFQDIADGVVEHIEAGGLLDLVGWLADIDQVEDGGEDLVHALHVLDPGVELGVDVEDAGHVVVAIGLALLLLVPQELLVGLLVLPVDHLEFLAAGAGEEGDHELGALLGEEGEFGVRAGGVLFDLLPEEKVCFELGVAGVAFAEEEGVVLESLGWEEDFDESLVVAPAFLHCGVPFGFLQGEIAKDELPGELADADCFVGDALAQISLQTLHIDIL